MDADRRMLVRTGLAVAALLAVSAATAAVAKGGAEERRVESVGTDLLGPAAPVGVRVPPVVSDEPVTVSAPPAADGSAAESVPVVITPATSARTSVPVAITPPVTVPATPPVTVPATVPVSAPVMAPVTAPVTTAPTTTEPAAPDAGAQPTRCLDLADLAAVRHDARTGVVRVEGVVGNCGSLDITFVVRVTDVSNHADAACDAGTRSTGLLVLGPGSGDAWSALTYPAPCPEPYTFRVTAVDADGEQLALRSLTFPG